MKEITGAKKVIVHDARNKKGRLSLESSDTDRFFLTYRLLTGDPTDSVPEIMCGALAAPHMKIIID